MTTDQILNIAIGAGLTPLLFGFFASLLASVREKMVEARMFVSLAVSACSLIFSITLFAYYHTFPDVIVNLILTAGIVFIWLQRLGYMRKKLLGSYKMAQPQPQSILDYLFGIANRNARVAIFAGFIVIGIPLMILIDVPTWILASSPAWFNGIFWVLEEVKFI